MLALLDRAVLPSGVIATPAPLVPGMSDGCLVLVFTSIVAIELLPVIETKAVLPAGVIATPSGNRADRDVVRMLRPCLHVERRYRIAERAHGCAAQGRTAPPLTTKAVLPSGATATPFGNAPTGMSSGCLVLVFTSIVDIELLPACGAKAVLPSGLMPRHTGSSRPGYRRGSWSWSSRRSSTACRRWCWSRRRSCRQA